jgi:subfamily B ATP-binding cassette protein MsbA
MDKGKLVEEGSHVQLMERKGLYYYLYTIRLNEPLA